MGEYHIETKLTDSCSCRGLLPDISTQSWFLSFLTFSLPCSYFECLLEILNKMWCGVISNECVDSILLLLSKLTLGDGGDQGLSVDPELC